MKGFEVRIKDSPSPRRSENLFWISNWFLVVFIYHLNILAEVSLFPQALMIHLLINSGLSNCPVSSLLSSVSRLLAGSGYVRLSRLQSDLLRAGDLLVRAGFILGLRSEQYQLGYILQQIVTDCLRLRNLHFLPWESSQKKDSWF